MPSITLLPGGLDNIHDPSRLGRIDDPRFPILKVLVEATNFDLDDNGVAESRTGYSSVYAGTPYSFWTTPDEKQAFFASAGVLYRFNPDHTATSLLTLNSTLPVCFEQINDQIVFSDMVALGHIDDSGTAAWFTAPDTTFPDEFKALMPGAQHLAFYHGILFAALGSIIYMSDPYNLGVMDIRRNQIPMPGYIRMLAAVEDGLWVATDENVGFISGTNPDDFSFRFVTDSAPPDGAYTVDYDEAGRIRVCWASTDGFCVGTAGGKYVNLSENLVALPKGKSGTCWLKKENGSEHYIAVIRDPDTGNVYTADTITINTQYA